MRELLFRGKSQDGWHYFGLWGTPNLPVIIPETIGQFTGLLDKKGIRIYEGDIVREELIPPRMNNIYEIKFNGGSFHLSNPSDKYVPLFAYDAEIISYLEVIGNIYESKHLLDNIDTKVFKN